MSDLALDSTPPPPSSSLEKGPLFESDIGYRHYRPNSGQFDRMSLHVHQMCMCVYDRVHAIESEICQI